jgi:hypothetical protein
MNISGIQGLQNVTIKQLLKTSALALLVAAIPASAQTYTIDPTGGIPYIPYSIDTSGATTGYYSSHGFVRTPSGVITSFDPAGSISTVPFSINTSVSITGSYADASGAAHGFVRDPQGNITSFDPAGSISTLPLNINTSGAITGSYADASEVGHGFVRDPQGNITSFDPAGSVGAFPSSINTSGEITGEYVDPIDVGHGFVRDRQGNFTSFDPAGSISTEPISINTSGAISGYYADASGVYHGFVRDPQGTITSFDPAGSVGTLPRSINTSGAITGYYEDPIGVDYGFVGTVPNGMDISVYTTPFPVPSESWLNAIEAGVSYLMVQAWGGKTINGNAQIQLTGAQGAGLQTGAYVLLTYLSNIPATYQVKQAVEAIGTAMAGLKVMAVDVEVCCGEFAASKPSTDYVVGAHVMDSANHIQIATKTGTSGTTPPAWNDTGGTTADGTITWQDTGDTVVSQAQRIAYISDAVSYIRTQYPSLNVVISVN